jgi:hypothetical protein
MSYDFKDVLSNIDPSQTYQFEHFTGGLVNVTVRATRASPGGQGASPDHGTLILKYAPPYVAALGKAAPFSQDRQVFSSSS